MGNPLYDLYGDMPLDRVWFLASLALSMVYNFMQICPEQVMVARLSPICLLESVHCVSCRKRRPKMEGVVLHNVGILGQGFRPSVAPSFPGLPPGDKRPEKLHLKSRSYKD